MSSSGPKTTKADFTNQTLLTLFEQTPLAQLVILPDEPVFTIAAVSEMYLRLAKVNRGDLTGRGLLSFLAHNAIGIRAENVQSLSRSLQIVMLTGLPDRAASMLNTPVLTPDGKVEYILHSVEVPEGREIAEQWQLFDAALSHTPDFTYTFDLEGRFTYVNRALLSLWQKSLPEALGKNFFELGYPPELAERLHRQIGQVIETKDVIQDHTPFTSPAGEVRHYEYIFVPVLSTEGVVKAVAGSTRDITERQRMEKALADSEQNLQRIFAQAPVAIVVFRGSDFVVELANPTYQALLSGRELVGRRFADILPELGQNVWDALHRVVDTGEPFTANDWYIPFDPKGNGVTEDRWFNLAYNPLRDYDGAVAGLIAVLTDVTSQVLARKELERVNRELEEFAFVASHDLQEPLRTVNIYTQLILRDMPQENPRMIQYGNFVQQGVQQMELLLKDLLTFSRTVLAESQPIGTADLSISLTEALAVMSSSVKEQGAVIAAGPLPSVPGDTQQMAHVFQNLISNALKYRRDKVPLEIRIWAERAGQEWVVSVEDNGIGFESQYSERIFGLFKRLHKAEYPGTGLGLAICRRIVARYGGRMWAEGTLGVGAIFRFALPAVFSETI